eukprot:2164577-Prymnesium_polylepis.1
MILQVRPTVAGAAAVATPRRDATRLEPYDECVERVEGADAMYAQELTVPHDIVLAVLTTAKRHGLIERLRRTWLSDTKAMFLTDGPGLNASELHKVVIFEGQPTCGAADRGGPAIHYANTSFEGQFKWVLMVDDDVLVSTPNLARFLSAYDPDVPL